jgi:hypothetical protein
MTPGVCSCGADANALTGVGLVVDTGARYLFLSQRPSRLRIGSSMACVRFE